MLGIGAFFERFKSRELDEFTFRAAVIDSFKEVLGFVIEPTAFSYSNGTINLNISPAAKGAVLLKKNELLKKIQERTRKKVVDVR